MTTLFTTWSRRIVIAAPVGLMFASAAAPAQTVRYRVTLTPGWMACGRLIPLDINDSGQVVGRFTNCPGVLWDTADDVLIHIGDLPGGANTTHPYGINELGQVVGSSGSSEGFQAFLWDEQNGMIPLGDLPGGLFNSGAYGINNDGVVCGVGYIPDRTYYSYEAFRWTSDDGMVALGDIPGGEHQSTGMRINDLGQIVGYSAIEPAGNLSDNYEAVLWQPSGEMQPLGFLSEAPLRSLAFGINNLGEICGESIDAEVSCTLGFLWTPAEGMQPLERIPDTGFTRARDINDRREIVGSSGTYMGPSEAVIWDASWTIHNLNDLLDPCVQGLHFSHAVAINNRGQILINRPQIYTGVGQDALLTPYVPGDLDSDGAVTIVDLVRMLQHFWRDGGATYADGDIDCDFDVDLADLSVMLANFGASYP